MSLVKNQLLSILETINNLQSMLDQYEMTSNIEIFKNIINIIKVVKPEISKMTMNRESTNQENAPIFVEIGKNMKNIIERTRKLAQNQTNDTNNKLSHNSFIYQKNNTSTIPENKHKSMTYEKKKVIQMPQEMLSFQNLFFFVFI